MKTAIITGLVCTFSAALGLYLWPWGAAWAFIVGLVCGALAVGAAILWILAPLDQVG